MSHVKDKSDSSPYLVLPPEPYPGHDPGHAQHDEDGHGPEGDEEDGADGGLDVVGLAQAQLVAEGVHGHLGKLAGWLLDEFVTIPWFSPS